MNALRSILYLSQVRAAAGLMDAVAHRDECVLLKCESGVSTAALLDLAENELSNHRLRCVRVYGPARGELALRDLIAQIVGRADPDALTDADLKAGFVTLTEPGEGFDRVVLLVTEAQNLQPSAMHYVQLAHHSSPRLRVVLAGQPKLAATLAEPAFAQLRRCMTCAIELPGPLQDETPDALSEISKPSPVPVARRRSESTPLVRVGLVASLMLLIGVIGWRRMPAPLDSVVHADVPVSGGPVLTGPIALIRNAPQSPARGVPVAQPDAVVAEQEHADLLEREIVKVFPPDLDTPADTALIVANKLLIEQAAAPAAGTPDLLRYEPFQHSIEQAEIDSSIREETPVVSVSANVPAPAQNVTAAPPQTPEPALASAPDAVPPPQLAAFVSPPTPSQPQLRPVVVALPSNNASRAGSVKPAVAPAAVLPNRPSDRARCRDILLNVQLGKVLSDADKQFLRDGCRAK